MYYELSRLRKKALIMMLGLLSTSLFAQKNNSFDQERAQSMLQEISSDIQKHYYDPKFHGLNWQAKVEEAKQKIHGTDSLNRALSEVAAALDSLNDSHTFFLPPAHANRYDYGWQAQVVGDRCFVIRVRPGKRCGKERREAGRPDSGAQRLQSESGKFLEDAICLQHAAPASLATTGPEGSGWETASAGCGHHHYRKETSCRSDRRERRQRYLGPDSPGRELRPSGTGAVCRVWR